MAAPMQAGATIDAQRALAEHLRAQVKDEVKREARQEAKQEADAMLRAEKLRAEALLEDERARTAAVIEAANARAEQAIDAYSRMSTGETENFQRQIEELQQALRAEQRRSEVQGKAQELKTQQALQATDAFKQMEVRLRDATAMTSSELAKALQRIDEMQLALDTEKQRSAALEAKLNGNVQTIEALRMTEARLREMLRVQQTAGVGDIRRLADKLKSAQRAAIALHASLLATRALNADLERRAGEALQAAEIRVAEARQLHAVRSEQDRGGAKAPEKDAPAVTSSIASNDS
jgi:hypothetical protein